MKRIQVLLLLLLFVFSGCSEFAKVQKSNDYSYKLRMAEQYYVKKKYGFAQQLYQELFPVYKGSDQFEDICYKYAYCAYNLKSYQDAENLFKSYVEYFPKNTRAEEMDYMRAYCYYKQSPKVELDQTNTNRAIGALQAFINTHPESPRVKEANEIIEKCRQKLEQKDFNAARLYYDLSKYKAAAVAFTELGNNYPDSEKADQFKIYAIRSYYQYAINSYDDKKNERLNKVIEECNDFRDRYPESSLMKEVERYLSLSQSNIKANSNEQAQKTT